MSEGARSTQVGTCGGVAINVDLKPLDHATPKKVQLSADYTIMHPPGYPIPPFMTGAEYKNLRSTNKVITNGSIVALTQAEAAALIAAGKATAV